MYITGQIYNLKNRLHQLPANTGELYLYSVEGKSYNYTGNADYYISGKIEDEFRKKYYNFTRNSSYLTGYYIT